MIIDLEKVSPNGDRFVGAEPNAAMGLEGDELVEVSDGLRYDITVQIVDPQVLVRGRLELDAQFRCSRCAEFFPKTVQVPNFSIVCEPPANLRSMDLTEELREAMILGFPSYPICGDGCKGLCSQCGVDLNRSTCKCQPPLEDRWSGLDNFNAE